MERFRSEPSRSENKNRISDTSQNFRCDTLVFPIGPVQVSFLQNCQKEMVLVGLALDKYLESLPETKDECLELWSAVVDHQVSLLYQGTLNLWRKDVHLSLVTYAFDSLFTCTQCSRQLLDAQYRAGLKSHVCGLDQEMKKFETFASTMMNSQNLKASLYEQLKSVEEVDTFPLAKVVDQALRGFETGVHFAAAMTVAMGHLVARQDIQNETFTITNLGMLRIIRQAYNEAKRWKMVALMALTNRRITSWKSLEDELNLTQGPEMNEEAIKRYQSWCISE